MKAVCVPFVLLLMFHLSQAQFTVQPVSVVQAEGVDAVFECLYLGAVSHSWGINGTFPADNEFQPDFTRTQPSGDTPATLTIPATAHYNNTVVQCRAVVEKEGMPIYKQSEIATMTMFAISVKTSNATDMIIVSWEDLKFTTNLTYCVNFMNKRTIGSNETVSLTPVCGLTETQFIFKYPNHTLCDTFFFTVTPVNGGNQMKGTASEPVAGSFTSARGTGGRTVVSRGEDSDEKLVMFEAMVPDCTLFILYRVEFGSLVGSKSGTLNASGNVSITFSLPTDILTSISVTLTAANGIDLMFESSLLSTSDIQRLLPDSDCSESISVCGRIEYAVDSSSPGALMYLVPTTNESSSIMLAVPKNMSGNFSISHIPPGRYSLLAFDLENNSLPRMPLSLASTSEILEVSTSQGTAAPVSDSVRNITVKLLSGDVEVNCSIPVTNCLVLVHPINSPEQLFVQLINFTDDRTIVFSVDFIGNVTVAVLIWGENNSIFEGQLSLITQLEIYTVMSSTTTVTTTTTNTTTPIISVPGDGSLRTLPIPVVAGIVIATLVVVCISLVVLVLVVLVVIKRTKRGRKVLNSSYSHMNRTRHFNGYSNEISPLLFPIIAFDCYCGEHEDGSKLCLLTSGADPCFKCTRKICLSPHQECWFAKEVSMGGDMFLLALPFASDRDLTDKNLSFRWSKRRPKISGSENELEFKSLLTGHFKGFISCEIFMNQKPFFTVYHCLKESVGDAATQQANDGVPHTTAGSVQQHESPTTATAVQLSQECSNEALFQLSTEIAGYHKYKHRLGLTSADIYEIDNDPRNFYSVQGKFYTALLKWKSISIDFDNPSNSTATYGRLVEIAATFKDGEAIRGIHKASVKHANVMDQSRQRSPCTTNS